MVPFTAETWFAAVAAAYGLLAFWLMIAGGGWLLRGHLAALAIVGMAWGGLLAAGGLARFTGSYADTASYGLDLGFLLAWFVFVYRLLRGPYQQSMPEAVRRSLYLFWSFILSASAAVAWVAQRTPGAGWAASFFTLSALAVALLGLSLAAQLLRDAPVEDRGTLRLLVAAVATVSVGQVVEYGMRGLAGYTPAWSVGVTAVTAALGPLILIQAQRRRPQWSLAIFVSPQARSYAPRVAAMLILLGIVLTVRPVLQSTTPARAELLAMLLLAGVGLPTMLLLFSERLSARSRVFLSKHFLPFRYDYREEWLRLIDTLALPDPRSPLPERAVRALAQIVSSPAGLLWMRRTDGGAFVCTAGWNTRVWPAAIVPGNDPVVGFMQQRQWILDTAELNRRPELYGGLQRPGWLDELPDALLVVPLISNEALIGFVVLLQSSSAFRLTFEEIDLLRTSGRQVAAFLAQYESDQQLAEAKQFEAFNRLTAFVMHDLKNLIAQQTLMVRNAARHKGNPAFFEDAIATIENSVARMNKLLQQLRSGEAAGPRQRVAVGGVLQEAVRRCAGQEPAPELRDEATDLRLVVDRDRLTAILAHLIRNAQEATGRDGHVSIGACRDGASVVITVADDGCGMDEDFIRQRLFRPFDSTKGSKGMGIGAYQARTFIVESGGSVEVVSAPGRGTSFVIRLPVQAAGSEAQVSEEPA